MLTIRPYDMPNKQVYFTMLCKELDSMGLEDRVADISKQYLYLSFLPPSFVITDTD